MSLRSLALAGAALLLLSACGSAASGDTPTATAACAEVETPTLQGGEHLLSGQEPPVPYSSTPPTSGWHASGAFSIAVQPGDEPLTEAEQVSVLEAGGVVVSHAGLDDADAAALADHVEGKHDGRVAVTAYDGLDDGEVAFTGWGVVQRCDAVDLGALDAFVDAYADAEPALPGVH